MKHNTSSISPSFASSTTPFFLAPSSSKRHFLGSTWQGAAPSKMAPAPVSWVERLFCWSWVQMTYYPYLFFSQFFLLFLSFLFFLPFLLSPYPHPTPGCRRRLLPLRACLPVLCSRTGLLCASPLPMQRRSPRPPPPQAPAVHPRLELPPLPVVPHAPAAARPPAVARRHPALLCPAAPRAPAAVQPPAPPRRSPGSRLHLASHPAAPRAPAAGEAGRA
ncbi:hypothetical protein PAHAL_3G403900 [Panicum hallii]|uniref:Uncharacterized protein n=1 Tax=Panicum hallii TaxID=206008 RepID=A0A2T8KKT7_9POAL|nr:hypothetical protein PAHAL_3G403900 [Panicum hallii]